MHSIIEALLRDQWRMFKVKTAIITIGNNNRWNSGKYHRVYFIFNLSLKFHLQKTAVKSFQSEWQQQKKKLLKIK